MTPNTNTFLYTITGIRQKLFRFLRCELRKKGIENLAPSYGDILFVLERKGPMTLQELAGHTIKDKSTISSLINRLEREGYIIKEKTMKDARFTNLSLTEAAMDLKPVLYGISSHMNERLFRGFSEEEKKTLFDLLDRISNNL